MKNAIIAFILVISCALATGCKKSDSTVSTTPPKIQVVMNDIPYPTETYLRIGYMLKTWEFQKEGLLLQSVVVFDNDTKTDLMTIEKPDLPRIYKTPLPVCPYWTNSPIDNYYFSIQLAIPLGQTVPNNVGNRFILRDTVNNKDVVVEGGVFQPRKNESPRIIASPVKGTNWAFINQSTNGYHFNATTFSGGIIGSGERFAFDNLKLDSSQLTFSGDPLNNESYYNYGDTLYAVASGTIVKVRDGRPENTGNVLTVTFNSGDELAGNHMIIDIGDGYFALYAHIIPGSFLVHEGQVVTEGQPIARLGNSGNSTEPHLHFQLCSSADIFFSRGLPFVLKKYTKIGVGGSFEPFTPVEVHNSMMEQFDIISFE